MHADERHSSTSFLRLGLAIAITSTILIGIFWHNANTLAKNSNSNHGDTLEEVLMGLMNEDHEVLALFDANGKKLLEWTTGGETNVRTPYGWFELANSYADDGVIVLHNHPKVDAAFSRNDLLVATSTKCRCEMVVTPFSLYTLQATKGWPDEDMTEKFFQTEVFDNYDQALAKGYIFTVDGTYYVTAALIEFYAEEFGLEFHVQSLNH